MRFSATARISGLAIWRLEQSEGANVNSPCEPRLKADLQSAAVTNLRHKFPNQLESIQSKHAQNTCPASGSFIRHQCSRPAACADACSTRVHSGKLFEIRIPHSDARRREALYIRLHSKG